MTRSHPEQRLQIAVAQYLGHALKPPTIWTAFPAGGGGRVRGAFLKAMGLKAGWPDILVVHAGRAYGIELKAKSGSLSPAQKAMKAAFIAAGCGYTLCRSIDDVAEALFHVGIPLSATVGKG